jgi:hypothetical protein
MLRVFSVIAGMIVLGLGIACQTGPAGAEVVGEWEVTSKDGEGQTQQSKLIISEEGGELKGVSKGPMWEIPTQNMRLENQNLIFDLEMQGQTISVQLTLEGDKLDGKWMARGMQGLEGPVSAVRSK